MIKDSGDRTEFPTGAVRDMREGKGRCDLLPLKVVAVLLVDSVLLDVGCFQATGDKKHLYSALKVFACETKVCINTLMLEVAKHFEEGALKYGDNNWQKGIPVHIYIDSAVRHKLKHNRGDKDESHYRAFAWNILCCLWTIDNKPEMNDMAFYGKENSHENNQAVCDS